MLGIRKAIIVIPLINERMTLVNNFTYQNITEIIFGKNTEDFVGKKAAQYGKKILFHYGGENIKKTGLYDKIISSLKNEKLDFTELGGVVPNPRLSLVRKGIEICKTENIDFILAVGGGSVIDSAKAIAIGSSNCDDVWNIIENGTQVEKCMPIGVVLTIPAAGSESSNSLVITNEDGQYKLGYGNNLIRPQFAILNPELTYSLPFYQTACGISDMLAHVMERYFTNDSHVDVSDRMCEAVMRAIMDNALKVKSDPNDYNNRAEIMWAGTVAHNDFIGLGRIGDWASHNIEHELSAIYDIAHGAGLSIIFPAWMKYVYKNHQSRFVKFATRVMDVNISSNNLDQIILDAIHRLEQFYKSMDLPTKLHQIGIDSSRFEEMAGKAGTLGNFEKLTPEDVVEIYKLAL
ncbi:NADH-dependent alcohol dehydrogenase [Clostridia bacterium]|nr:NADH-dependent alcohol dehydrogenase [Clostridia bacterium]